MQETRIELARRESLALGRLRGHVVECHSGQVWLTADGDGRDVILNPGQQWLVTLGTPVVVTAFEPSVLRLREPSPPLAFPSAAMRDALAALLHRRVPSPAFPDPSTR